MTREDIRAACDLLFVPGEVIEVRALGKWGTASGYFDDLDKLAGAVGSTESNGEYGGIYVTLNPVNPNLLARRANRIEKKLGKKDATTADIDITSRHWLPVDIDPVRPSGVSSSTEEHTAAKLKAHYIAEYLSDLGWPGPVVADSGNGAHLLYRIDLPNDDGSRDLVKGVLETLNTLFSDTRCVVDTANFNASRIWKLYGTTSRKGDNIPARPHRISKILSVPDEIRIVSIDKISHLAEMLFKREPPKPTSKDRSRGEPIDLGSWLSSHGIGSEQKPYSGGSLFVLNECPFSSAHKDGAYAIQFANGAIFAGCHHNSCGGGSQRWADLRERYEGSIGSRLKNLKISRIREKEEVEEGESETSPRPDNNDGVKKEAIQILHKGDPIRYMLDTFEKDHEGDKIVAECLVMSLASRSVINSKGLHVLVTGESGKGKSHAFDTMLQQVPGDLRLDGRMSDKALFYADGLRARSTICLDDVSLSDQMQEVLKGVTTSFKKPFTYRTVNKDRKGQICTIPERCLWWVAKMEGTGDDQVWNRMLTCWIDDSREQDDRVLARELEAAEALPEETAIRPEIEVIQMIWQALPDVHVAIPYAKRIRFSSAENRRNPGMLLDIIRSHAALMQYQREHLMHNGIPCVMANIDDFRAACRLYQALNGESGGQMSKLTRSESELISAIRDSKRVEIKVSEMQKMTGKTYGAIYKMIHGSNSHGTHYSGLLEKCPALSFLDRTDVTDGGETSRRNRMYVWDEQVYQIWSAGGGCWLDGHGPDDHEDPVDPDQHGGIADVSGRLAETFRHVETSGEVSDSHNNDNNKNNFLDNTTWRKEEEVYGDSSTPSQDDHIHDTVPATSAMSFPPRPPVPPTPSILKSDKKSYGGSNPPTSSIPAEYPQIKYGDFIEIQGGFGPGPCEGCGSKWVNYQEKMTRDRMKQPPRSNRKICRKCYEKARMAESMEIRALPGVLNTAVMRRVDNDLGRCQVCNAGKAVWYDPGMKTAVCEVCYQNTSTVARGELQQ